MTRQEAHRRREDIIDLATRLPITARQVAALFYPGQRDPLHSARVKLHALAARGELVREWLPDIGWVYGRRRDQLSRKVRHGLQVAELHVRLRRSGALRQWEEEVRIDDGQADARTVLRIDGTEREVWWEVERDRPHDRWDLYRARVVCVWTTDALAARQRVPEGVRGAVGGWSEDPLAIARRAVAVRPVVRMRLADEFAAVTVERPVVRMR